MLARVYSCIPCGLEAVLVEVEVDVQPGLPAMNIVGLADTAVKEAKERVKSALLHSGFDYPRQRITVNLVPAHVKKAGSIFDLAIAIAVLQATGQIPPAAFSSHLILGELSLNGSVRKVPAVLLASSLAALKGFEYCVVPEENKYEAALYAAVKVIPVESLRAFIETVFPCDGFSVPVAAPKIARDPELDFQDVRGQHQVKRALEVAAAGFHNVLMIGPPGCGKTMLARRIPGILPHMTRDEMIESLKIYSVSHQDLPALPMPRPFRAPHHTSSYAAMVGGGSAALPGEVSLAHNGVLFLDEFPEFTRNVREALREPVEDGRIRVSRAQQSFLYPARCMLIAAMNPCPCGYFAHEYRACSCGERKRKSYVSRISGPLLDRVDIRLQVLKVDEDVMLGNSAEEQSLAIQNRVESAWKIQQIRFRKSPYPYNAYMSHAAVQHYCPLNNSMKMLVKKAMQRFRLSGRALDQILKIARSIADLDGHAQLRDQDLLEALQYRSVDHFFLYE